VLNKHFLRTKPKLWLFSLYLNFSEIVSNFEQRLTSGMSLKASQHIAKIYTSQEQWHWFPII